MRYSLDFQQKVAEESLSATVEELAKKYKISPELIRNWRKIDFSDEKMKYTVRQKFYNKFPVVEAKIETAYSDFIVCSITDDEWEALSDVVSKIIFDFAYEVYKSGFSDGQKVQSVPKALKKRFPRTPASSGQPLLFEVQ